MSDQPPILEIKVVADEKDSSAPSPQQPKSEQDKWGAWWNPTSVASPQKVPTAPPPPQQANAVPGNTTPQSASNPETVTPVIKETIEPKLSLDLLKYQGRKHDYLTAQWQKARSQNVHHEFDIEEHAATFDRINVERWAKSAKGAPEGLMDVVAGFASGDRMQLVAQRFEEMMERFVNRAKDEYEQTGEPAGSPPPKSNRPTQVGAASQGYNYNLMSPLKSTAAWATMTAAMGHTPSLGGMANHLTAGVLQQGLGYAAAGGVASAMGGAALGVGAAAVGGYAGYKLGANTLEGMVEDGIIPTTKAFAKLVPVVHDYINLMEVADRRFQADMQKFGHLSPGLQQSGMIQGWMQERNRWELLGRQSSVGLDRTTLEQEMQERQGLNYRYTQANDKIEAAFSQAIYKQLNPYLETVVGLLEAATPQITGFIDKASITVDLLEAFFKALLTSIPEGPMGMFKDVKLWGQLLAATMDGIAAGLEAQKQKDMREIMKNAGVLGDLRVLMYGEDEQDDEERDTKRRKGPNLPRAPWGKGKPLPPAQ